MSSIIDRILQAGGTVKQAEIKDIRISEDEARRLEACSQQMDRAIARLSQAPAPRRAASTPKVGEETVH